uniref:Integrase, catalytic region, zinc finger, CCHC-type, peptidase aspartic, catalytic n=1 Tax=Tanacetum cinerariifolium TaxID=118510 RepID=A0A6L2NT00_TANCI|nr:hypothetical protein [Tanacetum cinerariifolium]
MILESIENGPRVYPTIEENGHIRNKKYAELTKQEKLQDNCDVQATNIVFQGLPPDVYSLVNHCQAAKDIWDRVKLLQKGIELSYQERECKLYNEFEKFSSVKGESLYEYYLCFAQLINDMHTIGMTMQQVQVNTKFLNALQPEWSATDVKLAKNMYNTNFDQLSRNSRWSSYSDNNSIECFDLDAYDSDCDDMSLAKAVLMDNLSSYDSAVVSEVPQHESNQNNDMINQSVQETQNFKQSLIDYVLDIEITSDSNIISYDQYLQQTQNAIVQETNSSTQQDSMIISMFEQMSE